MKIFIYTIIICISAMQLMAEGLNLNFEFNRFKYNKDTAFVEFAFSFNQENVEFAKIDDYFTSDLNISFSLNGTQNRIDRNWDIVINTENPIEKRGKIFIGVKQIILPIDTYQISVKLIDRKNQKNTEYRESELNISAYSEDKIEISDIEFAHSIENVDNQNNQINYEYVKSGLYVIPNPSNEIAGVKPMLNTYTEIYNCPEAIDSLTLKYTILNSMKIKVFEYIKTKLRITNNFYEVNSMLLDTLPSGVYYLNIELLTHSDNQIKSKNVQSKRFYLMNPQRIPYLNTYFTDDELYSRSEFAALTDEQCDEEFKQIIFIASLAEKEIWERLTDYTGKRKYLYAFWNNRKTDKTGKVNSERFEFKKLIEYANLYYSVGTPNSGWKTDRGRILLKYGMPSNTDTYTAKDGNKAYEVWTYDGISGGVKFYFVDINQNGRFALVHSTMFEEIQNSNWESQYLKQTR